MPTFHDPLVDAEELSAAARGLAHASRSFAEPIDTYRVLGDLQSAMFGLHQSLQQIAAFHTRLVDRASTDHGDRAAGREHALVAAMRLETAATHVDRATDHLMVAFAEKRADRLATRPDPGRRGACRAGRRPRDRPRRSPATGEPASPGPLTVQAGCSGGWPYLSGVEDLFEREAW